MNKTLVAFFSASGNTKRVAEKLAAAIDSDLYEIKPAVPYTSADLNWRDRHSRSSVEMNDPSSRPELTDYHANIAGYDRIFLGFPIWWYTAPTVVRSFLRAMISPERPLFCLPPLVAAGWARLRKSWHPAAPERRLKTGSCSTGTPRRPH